MSKQALIIVDLQNDYFPGGKWTLNNTQAAADNAAKLLADFRKKGNFVVHIRHEQPEADAAFFAAGSDGAKIHPSVINQGNEPVVTKQEVNSFNGTDLKSILDKQGITDVVIAGAMSHMCIDGTARAASDFGYKVTVVHDACTTRDLDFNGTKVPAAQAHAAFMAALGSAYGTLKSTKEFLGS